MTNRVWLTAVTTAIVTLFAPQVALAKNVVQDFTVDLTVDVTSGPLTGERYTGLISVDMPNLLNHYDETVLLTSITFDFGGIEFTAEDDVQDPDANSPRVNFQAGSFMGSTYIVSRFGERSTDIPPINGVMVDGFAIDNSEFGYIVGPNLYRGAVSYALPDDDYLEAQSVPEPTVWLGLITICCGCWLPRHRV